MPLSSDELLSTSHQLVQWHSIVSKIVESQCERDSRFHFISLAVTELLAGDFGLIISARDLFRYQEGLPVLARGPPTFHSLGDVEQGLDDSFRIFHEIVTAATYEVLDAYNIAITIDQVPTKFDLGGHIRLLQSLDEQSKTKELSVAKSTPSDSQSDTPRYDSNLVALSKQRSSTKIRILHLMQGAAESRIDCRLEVRDLAAGDIDEALSYVWGEPKSSAPIWVDNHPCWVTKNLYNILLALRREDSQRTIWIDAICINQSDPDEKAHQVRYMGEIYSKAKKTVI
ncbi:hypothetical protein GQX73_g5004 [Xylaria multiplex]|uniref:Heterokaryon incompatibility domain-containing protein n=1 Tax=Xylaria multiplex TaxID=323545 RepID=A0A7C8IP11_9PEZI|nr:hypothetical protein GQX73_g5004 [Xylaria multiplex]